PTPVAAAAYSERSARARGSGIRDPRRQPVAGVARIRAVQHELDVFVRRELLAERAHELVHAFANAPGGHAEESDGAIAARPPGARLKDIWIDPFRNHAHALFGEAVVDEQSTSPR